MNNMIANVETRTAVADLRLVRTVLIGTRKGVAEGSG